MAVLPDLCSCSFKGEILILFHCEVVKASSDMLVSGDKESIYNLYVQTDRNIYTQK